MARTMEDISTDDLVSEGARLTEPGKYHFLVEQVFDGLLPDGETEMNGSGMSVRLRVASGDCKDCTIGLILNDGDYSQKDHGKSARKKQTAFLIATNVVTPADVKPEGFAYDEQKAAGQQLVAELSLGDERNDGKRYLDWCYWNIYHVDDPRAGGVKMDPAVLNLIPKEYRREKPYFASLIRRGGGSSGGSQAAAKQEEPDFSGL